MAAREPQTGTGPVAGTCEAERGAPGVTVRTTHQSVEERGLKAVEELPGRSLAGREFLALWIRGAKRLGQQTVLCAGLTDDGQEVIVNIVECATENGRSCESG